MRALELFHRSPECNENRLDVYRPEPQEADRPPGGRAKLDDFLEFQVSSR